MLILIVGNGYRIPWNFFGDSVFHGAIIERDFVCCRSHRDINDCARSGKDAGEFNTSSSIPGIASAAVEDNLVLGSTNRDMEKDIISLSQIEACAINAYICIGL